IRYYSLMYIIGFFISYFMILYLIKKKHIKISERDFEIFILVVFFSAIAGGRLFYAFFYDIVGTLAHPLSIFYTWQGGMSFHGGLIGGLIGGIWYAKHKKWPILKLLDIAMPPLALSLFFGRIGNFLNGELYGRVTSASFPLAIYYVSAPDKGTLPRYPSELFQATQELITFIILWIIITKVSKNPHKKGSFYFSKKLKPGFLFGLFIMIYGGGRFILEFFRQPDPQMGIGGFYFGWMTAGQILCLIMIVFGIFYFYFLYTKKNKNIFYRLFNLLRKS
ncbi:MAG: prolipoprotein diacylglyceryl transferase, partial [Nitrospiraceae bacterium]|nr:prolipoprotein diacylglyceryl transferase [Nitrospiraceae bacterium]